METIKPKAYSIQGSGFCSTIDTNDWVVATSFCTQINKWDITIVFYGLTPSVLSGLIHTSAAGNSAKFSTHFGVTHKSGRSTIKQSKELVQLIGKFHVVGSHSSRSGQVNNRTLVVLSISTSNSYIQAIESIGVFGAVTIDNGVVEQCRSSLDFLRSLESNFVCNTTHICDNAVNFIRATKYFKVYSVALFLNFVGAVFFVDTTELCYWLSYQASVTISQSTAATNRGYTIIKSKVIQQKVRFSKFINNTSLNIIGNIQTSLG